VHHVGKRIFMEDSQHMISARRPRTRRTSVN